MKRLLTILSISMLMLFPQFGLADTNNKEAAGGSDLHTASYDGTWSGTIKCLYDPGLWPEDESDIGLTLHIHGNDIAVEQVIRSKHGEETKSEIDPGRFRLGRLGPNAIAISLDTGEDEDGTWFETWSFSMTLLDADHMAVHWTRVVNNIDVPKDKKGSKFSIVGMGELVRGSNQ